MRAQGHAANTLRARIGPVQRVAASAGKAPCSLATMDVIGWLDQQLAPATRAAYVASLRAWGRWLVETGRRPDDLARSLPRPRVPRGVPRPVAESDLQRILAVADGRVRVMILLAAYEGLRRHEIAKVRGEDVTADALYVDGKGGVRAMVPTHPRIAEVAATMPASGWWFPSTHPDAEHLGPHTVGRMMTRAMRAAGVDAGPHQLRHRYGTAVLRASGGNLRVAQELLRHASPATTAIYTQVDDDERREALRALL